MSWYAGRDFLLVSPAGAQPCGPGDRECVLSILDVDPQTLTDAATSIVELRRRARAPDSSDAEKIRALRELADLAALLAHRATRANEVGGLDPEALRVFVQRVGKPPHRMDGARAARRCLTLARRWTLQGSVARRVPMECLSRSRFDGESAQNVRAKLPASGKSSPRWENALWETSRRTW